MVTVTGLAVPVAAPLQPAKVAPLVGMALTLTLDPSA
jgi:hypothetical protein